MRQLDLDLTPADRYLNTPEGRVYREFVDGFHYAVTDFSRGGSSRDIESQRNATTKVERLADANLVGSRDYMGKHCPVLDLDVPALLVPSSTVGNNHLYIRKPMSWHHYTMLLQTLCYVGLLEDGYVGASLNVHEQTFARTPWTKK
jgi:hypothetical protein